MKALLRLVGVLAYRLGLAPVIMWLNRGVPRVLAYHACEETESKYLAGLACNTTPAMLRRQLEYLATHYRVISLQQLEAGPIPPRAVVITFDDGYRSVYDNALPLLRERGMPATMYLVAATQRGRFVWINELNAHLRSRPEALSLVAERFGMRGRTAEELLHHALWDETPASIEQLLVELAQRFHVDRAAWAKVARLYVDAAQIREMQAGGFSFGNHTETHPNLALLPEADCRRELEGPSEIRSFAAPFGFHTDTMRRVALELGFTSIMQIGGWNRPLNLARVRRVPINATTDAEFFAELEVIEPLKAWLRSVTRRPDYGYANAPLRPRQLSNA